VTRRAPRGDPDDRLEDRAGLALAALQNRHREAQPGAVAPLGSLVGSGMPRWQVYQDETPAQHAHYFGRDVTEQQLNDASAERDVPIEGGEGRDRRVVVRRVVEIWSI